MNLRFPSAWNSPPLVAVTGAAVVLGLPAVEFSSSLALLKGANVLAFLVNATAVSVPGRLDGQQDQDMRRGDLNPAKPAAASSPQTPLVGQTTTADSEEEQQQRPSFSAYTAGRTRTLVNPSGWAFAIWGPIYLGEAAFSVAQAVTPALDAVLPQVTGPFVAANLLQSLWCASFRPSYNEGWKKYVSVAMLGGTAYSLFHVHAIGCAAAASGSISGWYFVPIAMHFGWTTAATLVNLNGSLAMQENTSDTALIAAGHASALTATALGVGVALTQSAPVYGLTVAWALAACADGMTKRLEQQEQGASISGRSDVLTRGAGAQRLLCWAGSALCAGASIAAMVMK